MKSLLLLCALLFPVGAYAQVANAPAAPAFAATGAFFAVSVDDLTASTRWYSEKLGMKVAMRANMEKVSIVVLEGAGLIVELIDREGSTPHPRAVGQPDMAQGFIKAGVIVDDWDGLLRVLRERGVEFAIGPFPKRADQRANVVIKDNNGYLIQFFGR